MQYYTAVQQLCNGTAMAGAAGDRVGMTSVGSVLVGGARSGSAADEAAAAQACRQCSAMSFDPDKVTVQATQGNCPDPLGEPPADGHAAARCLCLLLPLPSLHAMQLELTPAATCALPLCRHAGHAVHAGVPRQPQPELRWFGRAVQL